MGKLGRNPLRNRKKYKFLEPVNDESGNDTKAVKVASQKAAPNINVFFSSSIDTIISSAGQKVKFLNYKKEMNSIPLSRRLLQPFKQNKKAKRLQKKSNFAQAVVALQKESEEKKKAARRQQTLIVGDMRPLADTLPVVTPTTPISDLHKNGAGQLLRTKPSSSSKAVKTFRQKKVELMADVAVFRQVLEHPAFKNNPANTMLEHLQNKFQH